MLMIKWPQENSKEVQCIMEFSMLNLTMGKQSFSPQHNMWLSAAEECRYC